MIKPPVSILCGGGCCRSTSNSQTLVATVYGLAVHIGEVEAVKDIWQLQEAMLISEECAWALKYSWSFFSFFFAPAFFKEWGFENK